jgi:hypothetical protein
MSRLQRAMARVKHADLPWTGIWLSLAYAALAGLFLASGLDLEAWDDSYFFKRIGLNILEHGSVAWNVEDGPVYGNTSQGFQIVALLPLLIHPGYYISIVKILLALCCVGLFAALLHAARALTSDTRDRALAQGLAFLTAASPFPLLLIHSGMETCLALLVLAINLVVIHRSDRMRHGTSAVVITTMAVYLVRPDAALISFMVLGVHLWLRDRRLPWKPVLACVVALLALLGLFHLYFGTALPLPFYLKSRALTVYDDPFVALDLDAKRRNIASYLVMVAPLLYVSAHGRSTWILALVLSFCSFNAYHYVSTVEIMSAYSRFYLPSSVPLALAAIAAAPRFRERSRLLVSLVFCGLYLALVVYLYRHKVIHHDRSDFLSRTPQALYLSFAAGAAVLLLGARIHARIAAVAVAIPLLAGAWRALPAPALALQPDTVLLHRYIDRYTTARGIHAVKQCLPEPLHLYHSEIGVFGVMFQRSTITDLAGLMDAEIARHGLDFDARCQADRPEVLYLPHRNYKRLRQQIEGGTCIRDYVRAVGDSSSPLYVRKDLAPDFIDCARAMGDRWVNARPLPR